MKRSSEAIIVTESGKPGEDLAATPAEQVESVFGRQKGSMTILGDIVNTEGVHGDGISVERILAYGKRGYCRTRHP